MAPGMKVAPFPYLLWGVVLIACAFFYEKASSSEDYSNAANKFEEGRWLWSATH
jgi:hypothetical protein